MRAPKLSLARSVRGRALAEEWTGGRFCPTRGKAIVEFEDGILKRCREATHGREDARRRARSAGIRTADRSACDRCGDENQVSARVGLDRHTETLTPTYIVNQLEHTKSPPPVRMRSALLLAAVGELATGSGLLIAPQLVGQVLLGQELTGVAIPVARVLGIALVSLGVACWPGRPAQWGMLTYSALATGYLAWLGIRGEWVGLVLWPAVVLHAVMTVLVYLACRKTSRTGGEPSR